MSQVAERQHHQDPGGGGGEESHHHLHHRPSPDGDPLLGLPNFTGFDPYTGPGSGSSGSGGGLLADTDGVFSEGLPSRLLERPLVDGADSSGGTYRPWESTERSIASSIANGNDQFHFSGYHFSTPSSGGGGGSPLPSFSTFQSSYPGLQAPMTARELENFTGDDRLLVYNNGSTGPPTPLSSSTVVSTPTPPAFTNGSSIAVVADIKPPLSDLKAFNHGIEMPTSSPAPHVGADQGGPQTVSVLTPLQPPNGGQLKRAGQIKRPFEALTPDSIKREHSDSSPRLESTGVHQVSAVTSSDLLEVGKQHHQHQQPQHTVNNNGFHHHHHQQQQHQQHHQQHQTPQHVHPHHHPHPHQQQQHLLLRQQQQHQEDVPSSAGGDKPTKKKRKRCGECSGCQTKENCGGCAPCKNERSHQICKMRRCDKLVEKKAPRERGKNASNGQTTANRQVAPSNQSFGAASPSANTNTPTTVNNGSTMLPADPRPGSYPSSAAVWPSGGQNPNPQWPAAAQFFDPRPTASLHYAHAQTPAAAFYATPTAATNISTIDTGAHFASATVDPFAHAPTAASVQFGAANGFHAGPSYLVSNGGEKGAHVLIPVSSGDLLAAKMAVTPQGVMPGLGRPPGGLMVSTTITPLAHHAQLTQSLNSQPGHPLYSPRPNSHSSNGCDDVSSVRCSGDSGAPTTAATTSPGYTCSNVNQHASLQDRLKQKIYERQQQQQQHSPRFNKHPLHMSDSVGYAANDSVFHHSTAETALNGGGGGCYTAADSQVGSSVSSDRVTSSSGSLEMHQLLSPQQKHHQEHFLVVRAADVSVMKPRGATAALVCPPSLPQDCHLAPVQVVYVLLTYLVLVRRGVESGRKYLQIGITALSAAQDVWIFSGLAIMHFSSIQVLL